MRQLRKLQGPIAAFPGISKSHRVALRLEANVVMAHKLRMGVAGFHARGAELYFAGEGTQNEG